MGILVLVRHGRTTANATGVLAGWAPGVDLDQTGREQVAALGSRWSAAPPVAIVSSPLPRCRQTAAALRSATGVDDVQIEEELGECHYGAWTGQPLADLAKDPLWRVVQDDPTQARFPDHPDYRAESLLEMQARAVAAINAWDERISSTHGAAAVWMAVSHGDVIKALLADALGSGLDNFQRIVVDPASVSVVQWRPGPLVLRVNDTSTAPVPAGDLSRFAPRADTPGDATGSDGLVGGGAGAP